jgi:hypothetical protein
LQCTDPWILNSTFTFTFHKAQQIPAEGRHSYFIFPTDKFYVFCSQQYYHDALLLALTYVTYFPLEVLMSAFLSSLWS